ncbi:MAG: hypothetical protein ACWA5W_11405 [Phycisphaerales bacterium]
MNEQRYDEFWSRFRRGVLVCIGSGCVVLGLTLMVTLVRPETLMTLSTAQLGGIIGFVVLPGLTMLAIRYDRAVVKRCVDIDNEIDQADRVTHQPHRRGQRMVLHQRSVERTEKAVEKVSSH